VDFELSPDQRAISDAVEALLARHAGAARAIGLRAKDEVDSALEHALAEAGFLDLARGDETGALEAALLVEAVSRAGGLVSIGASALVAPLAIGESLAGPIALALAGDPSPIRYGAQARTLLLLDGEDVEIVALRAGDARPVRSAYGYPRGRIDARPPGRILAGAGSAMRRWWRVALATEMVGAMDAALAVTTAYLKQRRQFGRAIASFQAVQHRLAECAIAIEGSRWLAREAAWRGAPHDASTAAAAYTAATAEQVFAETHQLTGAIGYTLEHDLHVWSMRLQALRLELGGAGAHRRALAQASWRSRADRA
jgi:alkylation response protein AidB-like acyl-CoA dehydrogenase